jgi:regulator of sigma E protease
MTIQLIFEFILALGALIFVHEFGHFIAMKVFKIEVEEFGFGYPPRLAKLFVWGGTQFTLNWIPFGGFTRPKGENDPTIPGSMAASSPWKRIVVLLAGPFMNILTAVILFMVIYGIIGQLPDRNRVQLVDISPDSPAAVAGLKAGDILVSVDGVEIHSLDTVRSVIYSNLGKPIDFTYERDSITNQVSITPITNPGSSGAVGIYMSYPMVPYTIWNAIPESFSSLYDYGRELVGMLGKIVQGQSSTPEGRLVGLKGMFDLYASMRETPSTPQIPQAVNALAFIASISISLGLMNLLPIPALDGGRILFTLPEIIIHRRIPPKYEVVVNFVSFALLIVLMIYINLQDFIHPITTPLP